jgi:cell division protein FtsI/penicillin-binding protein 2
VAAYRDRATEDFAADREHLLRRAGIVLAAVLIAYLIIWLRVGYCQTVERPTLEAIAGYLQPKFREPAGQPGDILDVNQRVLATSIATYTLKVDPLRFRTDLKNNPAEIARAAAAVAGALGLTAQEVAAKVGSQREWEYLIRRVSPDVKDRLTKLMRDKTAKIPSMTWEREYRRAYPLGTTACQALGWRGPDHAPRCGLEQMYDFLLMGQPGSAVGSRDRYDRVVSWASAKKPVAARPGRSLVLTIDADIQQAAEVALDHVTEAHTPAASAAIVMDPKTGRVLAMASRPSFDPNWFSGSLEGRKPEEADLKNPLVNHGFEAGSAMKGFTIAEALEEGLTKETEMFSCGGRIPDIGGRPLFCDEGRSHGSLDLRAVMSRSCNISAARLAMRIGGPKMVAALRKFGFGTPTRIGYRPEGFGLLPPGPGQILRIRDVANMGFGQGLSVTIIQLCAGYASLVNDGVYMQPYVVDRVLNADGKVFRKVDPVALRRVVSPEVSHEIRGMMRLVVDKGTGKAARIPGVGVGGKTGTAQKPVAGRYGEDHIAVFVLATPIDNPRFMIAVMADSPKNGYHGGDVAAPAAREIAMAALRLHGQLPAEAEVAGEGKG